MRSRCVPVILVVVVVAALSACGDGPERPTAQVATPVLEGVTSLVWNVGDSDLEDENLYEVAVVFRLRNPATSTMPEASYRVQLTDAQGAIMHVSPAQRTALAAGESRYVVYTRDDVSPAGGARAAPSAAEVTTHPSQLGSSVVPPSAQWRSRDVRMSCDEEEFCDVTGSVEWTGDATTQAPMIAVVAFDRDGKIVTAGLSGSSGEQLAPRQAEDFEVSVIAGARKPAARVEVIPHLLPD
jgi:hypothetical protein